MISNSKMHSEPADESFATATAELGSVVVFLRCELRFSRRLLGGHHVYVVEDPVGGHHYQLSLAEYTLASLMDGQRTWDQVVALAATPLRDDAYSVQEAASLAHWLVETGLGNTTTSESYQRIAAIESRNAKASWVQKLNPLMMKWSFGSPDRMLTWLTRYTGWAVSTPVLIVWCCLLVGRT